jgi:tetratricopeptide (TPR) repeat protein
MAIESLREPDNCDFSIIAANRLLELDNRNSQGWFIKAACANIDRKFDLAVKYVDNSIKFDPLNVYYIVSKAKLLISANRLDEAELTLSKAKSINPSEPDIGSVEESLRILTNQSS